ncbi:hypothetical protein [Citreimonas salinaria]|uniref:Uncharacterized protein n=1 Tax=Citreimonas salinaria TaxID=321339 RepID=A0A1H3N7T0_9RHOB|nr:hypothetical protein [Citreimonas salinaria]SDY84878.1 hypothetical protein SAMN05444340_12126 [Citreimonas salinaria]
MRLLALIALAAATFAAPVSAAFVGNRSAWTQLDALGQFRYVQGFVDGWLGMDAGNPEMNQYMDDIRSCVIEMGLTARDFTEIVENQYEDLSNWEKPPYVMIIQGVREVCIGSINRARADRGQGLYGE